MIFQSLQLYQMKTNVANLGHYLCCSKCACAKQWGPDPGEALGVALLSFTTPICRCPDSGTGIRNIQFLLLELLLCFLIQRVHQVNLTSTDSHCSQVTFPQHQFFTRLCLLLYWRWPRWAEFSNHGDTEMLALPRPTVLLRVGHMSQFRGMERGFPARLTACSPESSPERGGSPLHSSPQHFLLGSVGILPLSCQAVWNPPRDSRTAQETSVLNLASQIPFWG